MTDASARSTAGSALGTLRERFRAASAGTVATFASLAAELARTPHAAHLAEQVRAHAHRVHGTAGSYGFTAASRLAERLERRAGRWAADPTLEHDKRATIVAEFTLELVEAFGIGEMSEARETHTS